MRIKLTKIAPAFNILQFIVFNTLLSLIILVLFACSPVKKLHDGESLLQSNYIKSHHISIPKSEIEVYIKQKPNRKILGLFRLHLELFNLANEGSRFGKWLMQVGEAPIIYDSITSHNSARQIQRFLNSKGYFNCHVNDSVVIKNMRAYVYYNINSGKPYRVKKIQYEIEDEGLLSYVKCDSLNTLLSIGQIFDVDKLQKERDRSTRTINNAGFFDFTKDFIYFKVDSNYSNYDLTITLGIKKNLITISKNSGDTTYEIPHHKYYIKNVFVDSDYENDSKLKGSKDTLLYNGFYILFNKKINFRPTILLNSIFILKGDFYKIDASENTYKRLSELKAFKFVNIKFIITSPNEDSLNCFIQLHPVLKQTFAIETEGTNTGGDLGIAGSLIYQNKNLFKGAEVFEVKLRGGFEVQQLINQNQRNTNITTPFNTIEFGPEINLYVPRFLFLPLKLNSIKNSNPKTIFSFTTNYQQTPDYTRLINKISFGYSWKSNNLITHLFNPIEVSFVQVNLKPDFQTVINEENNVLLQYSYEPHIITDTHYALIYNDQGISKSRDHHYFKFNIESSGSILRELYKLNNADLDVNRSYEMFGIPFAQYVRIDADYRYFKKLIEHQFLAFRLFGGIGKPFGNSEALPFEKSFYAGGANDIRAWEIRSLGPGSYNGITNFDQIGDMQMEGNVEYRVKLLKQLNGALFVDAGNVWLLSPQPSYPNGNFQLDRFYKEIAIGTGIGARLDFNFFIIRLDMGVKLRDPQFNLDDRWVIGHIFDYDWKVNYKNTHSVQYSFLNFNLGIGYPF